LANPLSKIIESDDLEDSNPKLPLSILRKVMTTVTGKYLYLNNPPSYNLLNNSFAGSGKSTITFRELMNSDSLFIYLVNNHDVAKEQIEKNPVLNDITHIESRNRLCIVEEYKNLNKKYKINIKHFCKECPHNSYCEYYERMRDIQDNRQSWVGVHHHLGGLANSYVEKNDVDAVVIDEYFIESLYKETQIHYRNVLDTTGLLTQMVISPERDLILNILQQFSFGIQNDIVDNRSVYKKIINYYTYEGSNSKLKLFVEEYEKFQIEIYETTHTAFRNVVSNLIYSIINIYKHYKPFSDPDYLKYINLVYQIIENEKTRKHLSIAYFDLEALDLPCKVIILDATTPANFYQYVFNKKIKTIKNDIEINSKIYQLKTAKFVMKTLDNPKSFDKLAELVKLIVEKHNEEVLCVSRIKYKKRIKEINPNLISTDHYPLKASNKYEHLNNVILFGTPESRRDVLKRKAALLNYDEDKYHYVLRENEMLQALHRIRPAEKTFKNIQTNIHLLTSVDLGFKNSVRLTLSQYKRMLTDNIVEYHSSDKTNNRITQEIIDLLKNENYSSTEILGLVKGKHTIIRLILRNLIKDKVISKYSIPTGSKGRKPIYYKLI